MAVQMLKMGVVWGRDIKASIFSFNLIYVTLKFEQKICTNYKPLKDGFRLNARVPLN